MEHIDTDEESSSEEEIKFSKKNKKKIEESEESDESEKSDKEIKEEFEGKEKDNKNKVKDKIGRTIKNILPVLAFLGNQKYNKDDTSRENSPPVSSNSLTNIINHSLRNEIVFTAAKNKKRKEILDSALDEIERVDISLDKILDANLQLPELCRAIELYTIYNEITEICNAKINIRNQINDLLKESGHSGEKLDKNIFPTTAAGIRRSIDNLDTTDEIKERIREIHKRMLIYNPGDTSHASFKEKLSWCLQLPWRKKEVFFVDDNTKIELKMKKVASTLQKIREVLDEELYGMSEIKDEFIKICNTRLRTMIFNNEKSKNLNNLNNLNITSSASTVSTVSTISSVSTVSTASTASIALCGPPGVGKTTIAAAFAKAIGLPFEKIALGGMDDASIFKGVQESWVGAAPSILLRVLARSKVNNPVILFDEIDKISLEGHRGQEVQASLLHITDPGQNHSFRDNFLSEFEHDLSNIFFIFAMNDESKIDSVLKNRLDIIHVKEYNRTEKIGMIKEKLWSKFIEKNIGYTHETYVNTSKKSKKNDNKNLKLTLNQLVTPENDDVYSEILNLSDNSNCPSSIRSIEFILKRYMSHLALELTMKRAALPYVVKCGEITAISKKLTSVSSDRPPQSMYI